MSKQATTANARPLTSQRPPSRPGRKRKAPVTKQPDLCANPSKRTRLTPAAAGQPQRQNPSSAMNAAAAASPSVTQPQADVPPGFVLPLPLPLSLPATVPLPLPVPSPVSLPVPTPVPAPVPAPAPAKVPVLSVPVPAPVPLPAPVAASAVAPSQKAKAKAKPRTRPRPRQRARKKAGKGQKKGTDVEQDQDLELDEDEKQERELEELKRQLEWHGIKPTDYYFYYSYRYYQRASPATPLVTLNRARELVPWMLRCSPIPRGLPAARRPTAHACWHSLPTHVQDIVLKPLSIIDIHNARLAGLGLRPRDESRLSSFGRFVPPPPPPSLPAGNGAGDTASAAPTASAKVCPVQAQGQALVQKEPEWSDILAEEMKNRKVQLALLRKEWIRVHLECACGGHHTIAMNAAINNQNGPEPLNDNNENINEDDNNDNNNNIDHIMPGLGAAAAAVAAAIGEPETAEDVAVIEEARGYEDLITSAVYQTPFEFATRFTMCLGNATPQLLRAACLHLPLLWTLDVARDRCRQPEQIPPLRAVPRDISRMQWLQKLVLRGHDLAEVPAAVLRLGRLCVLDLSYNRRVSVVPENIGGSLKLLYCVNLSGTSVSLLPQSLLVQLERNYSAYRLSGTCRETAPLGVTRELFNDDEIRKQIPKKRFPRLARSMRVP